MPFSQKIPSLKLLRLLFIFFLFIGLFFIIDQALANPIQIDQLIAGNNRLAFLIYKKLQQPNENIIFSPYSLSSGLAILALGANGHTRSEITRTLHLPDSLEGQEKAFDKFEQSLNYKKDCENIWQCKWKKFLQFIHLQPAESLFTANALWMQDNLRYNDEFVLNIKKISGIEFYKVDFVKDPQKTIKTINLWAASKTAQKIQNLLSENSVNQKTRLIITSSIYFKDKWKNQFDVKNTDDALFNLIDGKKTKVKMMHQSNQFAYFENKNLQLVIMPYANTQLAMAIFLPKPQHSIDDLAAFLSEENFKQLLKQSANRQIMISLPKFSSQNKLLLAPLLKQLGIATMFEDHADFSKLTSDKIFVSDIFQKALIEVDEEGTTAAAVTSIVSFAGAELIPEFTADHPFIFVIYDTKTNAILFIGQVADPNQ